MHDFCNDLIWTVLHIGENQKRYISLGEVRGLSVKSHLEAIKRHHLGETENFPLNLRNQMTSLSNKTNKPGGKLQP